MIKFFAYILIGLFVLVMFFAPTRNYMNNLFLRDKPQLKEEQIIGTVSGYSPRVEEIARIGEPQEKVTKAKLPKDRKKQIQIALQKAGFYKGKIYGKIGTQAQEAIKAFQKAKGLKIDGTVGAQTWVELNKYLKD